MAHDGGGCRAWPGNPAGAGFRGRGAADGACLGEAHAARAAGAKLEGQELPRRRHAISGAGTSEPPPPPTIDDKRWLSEKRLQPGAGAAPAVVPELNGKRVRIGGYVVPLDFEATNVKEFLLVPFVGACIHVPPPPPNQIIYVKSAKGFDVQGSFDPVYVTGTIKTASQYTGLAETGYSIDAEKVDTRKE